MHDWQANPQAIRRGCSILVSSLYVKLSQIRTVYRVLKGEGGGFFTLNGLQVTPSESDVITLISWYERQFRLYLRLGFLKGGMLLLGGWGPRFPGFCFPSISNPRLPWSQREWCRLCLHAILLFYFTSSLIQSSRKPEHFWLDPVKVNHYGHLQMWANMVACNFGAVLG